MSPQPETQQWRVVENYAGYRVVTGRNVFEAVQDAVKAGAVLENITEIGIFKDPWEGR